MSELVVNGKKRFVTIWLGQLVSIIGSGLTGFSLGVWVYQKTGLATYYALIVLCTALPGILIRPLAGALADRFSRRTIMIIADFGASLGIFFIAMMIWTNNIQIWHIYLGMGFSSIFTGIGIPAYQSAITQLIPKNFYAQASGMIQAAGSAQFLISPVLAGILMPVIGINGIILMDFASFIIAVAATLSVKIPPPVANPEDRAGDGNFFTQILDAFTYIKERSGLMILIIVLSLINFLMGFLISLIGPMILSFTTSKVLGIGESVSAVGMMISSILILLLPEPKKLVKNIFTFLFITGFSYSIAGLRPNFFVIAIPCFTFFLTLPFINTYIDVILRRKVAHSMQGRVYALTGAIAQTGLILSYVVAGPLSDGVFEPLLKKGGPLASSIGQIIGIGAGRGIGFLFIITGILICLVAIGAYALPRLKNLEKELPDAEGAPEESKQLIETTVT